MSIGDTIAISIGLPEEYLQEAAEILYDSFQQKFEPIMDTREQGVSFLQKHLNPKGTIAAMKGKQLVGIAGVCTKDAISLVLLYLIWLANSAGCEES